jgi:hypothetical protein
MKSVYCSFNGDLKLICSTNQPIKINIESGYFILNFGDGFLYIKNKINAKVKNTQKKLFSTFDYKEIFFSY